MGLSAQVAFSSLLAFFPAMIFLVGLVDLFGVYGTLQEFLRPVAPGEVLDTIETLQKDTSTDTSVVAFVVGASLAIWAASGAMRAVIKSVNRAYDRVETRAFWKTRLIAIVLVCLTGLVLAGLLLLIVFGGLPGTAIADKAGLGGAFELVWGIVRWPIAFLAILLFFSLVYYLAPNVDHRDWKWLTPGAPRQHRLARARACSRSTRASPTRTRRRTVRLRAGSCCCGSTTRPSRSCSAPSSTRSSSARRSRTRPEARRQAWSSPAAAPRRR